VPALAQQGSQRLGGGRRGGGSGRAIGLARGVHADLAAVGILNGAVVKLVHRPVHQGDVAPPVHMGQHGVGHRRRVVHIHVGVHEDHRLAEHHQPDGPDAVHHLLGVAGVARGQAGDDQVVEDTLGGHGVVGDLALEEL